MRLNLGCGEHYADGWVNTDLHKDGPKPDVVCSLLDLPFKDAVADMVYCGHVLEHIAPEDMVRALREIHRVLAPDGRLTVVGPDINLTRKHEPVLIDGVVNGGRRWPGDEHRWTASGGVTLAYVTGAGFAAWLMPVAEISDRWPVVDRRARWQFAITATKTRR